MRVREVFSATAMASLSGRFIMNNNNSRNLISSSISKAPRRHWSRLRFLPPSKTQTARSMFGTLRMGEEGLQHGPSTPRNALVADASRPRPQLRECIQAAPSEPGVYIMESADGQKLYIGKSVKLSSRVSSYFASSNIRGDGEGGEVVPASAVLPGANLSRRIAVMTILVERIEYIATASGAEALLLEASLIRQHQPPFNVLLKDDKRIYPYACVTWSEPYPRLLITKDRPRRGGGAEDRYYGPFVDAGQLKAIVALVRRVLPLRERHRPLYKDKPCLNYDLGLCPGPCQGLISEEDYAETVRLAEMVFRGEGGEILARLQERMEVASRAERFERAGEIKAQMALVRGGLLGSALHFSSRGAAAGRSWAQEHDHATCRGEGAGVGSRGGGIRRDVVAVGRAGDLACFQIFQVRDGRLTGRLGFTYRMEDGEGEGEVLSRGGVLQACLERYWGDALQSRVGVGEGAGLGLGGLSSPFSFSAGKGGVYVADVPDEIVTADALSDCGAEILSELLSAAREAAVVDAAAADANASANANAKAGAERGTANHSPRGVTGPIKTISEKDGESGCVSGRIKINSGEGGKKATERRTCGRLPPVAIVHGGASVGGERHHLCVMVLKNAELEAKRLRKGCEDTALGLSQLAHMLGLASLPARIEGYDVSHTGGGQAVASAVSFVDGKARPDEHRRYRIQSPEVRKGHSDDYASLREVIARRFAPPPQSHVRGDGATEGAVVDAVAVSVPVPDLILIDGGRGQLAAALEGAADAADMWRSTGRNAETVATALPMVEGVAMGGVSPAENNNKADPPPSSVLPLSSTIPSSFSSSSSSSFSPSSSPSSSSSSLMPSPSQMGRAISDDDPDAILLSPGTTSSDTARCARAGMGASSNNSYDNGASVDVGGGRVVAMVSLAKKEEEVYVPWAMEPLAFTGSGGRGGGGDDGDDGPQSPGVMILRQVRDEAHRFAVTYHRKLRGKEMFLPAQAYRAMEDDVETDDGQRGFAGVPGLSSKVRKALAEAFGSLEGARVAGEAELRRIPGVGPTLAKRIIGP